MIKEDKVIPEPNPNADRTAIANAEAEKTIALAATEAQEQVVMQAIGDKKALIEAINKAIELAAPFKGSALDKDLTNHDAYIKLIGKLNGAMHFAHVLR